MVVVRFLLHRTGLSVCLVMISMAGCVAEDPKGYTRMHLQNESDANITFLAIDVSEDALSNAENRLLKPLAPDAVYSAVLSRPGNYWVRTEVETDGYIVQRVAGPVRVSRGVLDWPLEKIDATPLYSTTAQTTPMDRTRGTVHPALIAVHAVAGRMSFKSN